MPANDVIQFPERVRSYVAGIDADPGIESKLNACLLVQPLAEMLYQARSYWIGGQTLGWHELTPQQKHDCRMEIERLIKEALIV